MFNELSYAVDIDDLYTWKNMIAVGFYFYYLQISGRQNKITIATSDPPSKGRIF